MAKSLYSKSFKDKIISEYNNGKTKSAIKREYDIPYSTMNHWINNENSIYVGNIKYSDEIVNNVLNEYKQGKTVPFISNKYQILSGTIYSWIKKAGISRQKGISSLCKNQEYFDNINTEMKAYFLGFIVADGNVSICNNQYALKITLQKQDRYVIEKMLDELQSKNTIRDFKQKSPTSDMVYDYSYVSIGNKHLVKSLIRLGVIPAKTFHETIPNISDNLMPHFIRGFFDGDGIAYKTNVGYGFGFVCNQEILEQIKMILNWNNVLTPHAITNGIYTVITSDKHKLLDFYNYMYSNATFYLKRKYDKLKAIVDLVPSMVNATEGHR